MATLAAKVTRPLQVAAAGYTISRKPSRNSCTIPTVSRTTGIPSALGPGAGEHAGKLVHNVEMEFGARNALGGMVRATA